MHLGGEGLQPDTLQFEYEVQLFNGGTTIDKEAALQGEPVYTKRLKSSEEMIDTIAWDSLSTMVKAGDYLVLRIQPFCTNSNEVG